MRFFTSNLYIEVNPLHVKRLLAYLKADKYNIRVYHNIATVKESENDKSLGQITVWHITVSVNFKRIRFFVAKGNMPKDMSAIMQQEKAHGHPISII